MDILGLYMAFSSFDYSKNTNQGASKCRHPCRGHQGLALVSLVVMNGPWAGPLPAEFGGRSSPLVKFPTCLCSRLREEYSNTTFTTSHEQPVWF